MWWGCGVWWPSKWPVWAADPRREAYPLDLPGQPVQEEDRGPVARLVGWRPAAAGPAEAGKTQPQHVTGYLDQRGRVLAEGWG